MPERAVITRGLELRAGSEYDPATAAALAEHAAAVYLAPDAYWEACKRAGYGEAVTITSGATQVGLAVTAGRTAAVLACSGSAEGVDWLENLRLWRSSWPGVLPTGVAVHNGFLRQVRRVRDTLRSRIDAALGDEARGLPVFVAGHSLGGACAPLLAVMLARDLAMVPAAVYTFEAPRSGNRDWSEWWARRYGPITHRVVAIRRGQADIITRVPLSRWGWWHIGRPQMLRDGVRYESEEEWEAARSRHPTPALAQWRVLSRLMAAAQAHQARALVDELRALLDA